MAEADFKQSESVLWHLRVAEGDRLSERSEGRKLPQRKTRALAVLPKLKTLFGGASGGRNTVPAGQQKSKSNPLAAQAPLPPPHT